MKPRISYADLQWQQAFEKLKALPEGTKLYARGLVFRLDGFLDEPHPPALWLRIKHEGATRDHLVSRGDPLMMELTTEAPNVCRA